MNKRHQQRQADCIAGEVFGSNIFLDRLHELAQAEGRFRPSYESREQAWEDMLEAIAAKAPHFRMGAKTAVREFSGLA